VTYYGRSDEDWDVLVEVGLAFLREQARLNCPTSYTDMNRELANRTGLRPFDFDRDDERAAMGQLLSRITRLDRDERGSPFMISALVHYLGENDAGDGFYRFAAELGLLSRGASPTARLDFWIGQCRAVAEAYS